MKRLLASLAITAILLTGCGSVAPTKDVTTAQSASQSNRVFVTFQNTKGGLLTADDVAKFVEAKGAAVNFGPLVLDVVPFFGTPEKLQILSVAGKNVNVYIYGSADEASKAFERAKNPATADPAPEATSHYVLWGNLLVTTELDLLPLIGNCQPAQEGTECAPFKIEAKLVN